MSRDDAFDRFTAAAPARYWTRSSRRAVKQQPHRHRPAALGLRQLRRRLPRPGERLRLPREAIARSVATSSASNCRCGRPARGAPEGDCTPGTCRARLADDASVGRDAGSSRHRSGMASAAASTVCRCTPTGVIAMKRKRSGQLAKAFESMVSLPLYAAMSDADVDRVIGADARPLLTGKLVRRAGGRHRLGLYCRRCCAIAVCVKRDSPEKALSAKACRFAMASPSSSTVPAPCVEPGPLITIGRDPHMPTQQRDARANRSTGYPSSGAPCAAP